MPSSKRPSAEESLENRWLLPTDYMIKKRERAVFLGNRLKVIINDFVKDLNHKNSTRQEYSEEYHSKRDQEAKSTIALKGLTRSHSVQEELLTTP